METKTDKKHYTVLKHLDLLACECVYNSCETTWFDSDSPNILNLAITMCTHTRSFDCCVNHYKILNIKIKVRLLIK